MRPSSVASEVPGRLGRAARRVHAGGRRHRRGRTHALWPNLDPRTAAREPIARARSDRRAAMSSAAGSTRARARVAGGPVVRRHRGPPGTGGELPSTGRRRRHAIPHEARCASDWSPAAATGSSTRGSRTRGFSLTPAEGDSSLLTAFVQDEIALFGNRLAVTLGSQVQCDSDSGAGVQPNARVMWKLVPATAAVGGASWPGPWIAVATGFSRSLDYPGCPSGSCPSRRHLGDPAGRMVVGREVDLAWNPGR